MDVNHVPSVLLPNHTLTYTAIHHIGYNRTYSFHSTGIICSLTQPVDCFVLVSSTVGIFEPN